MILSHFLARHYRVNRPLRIEIQILLDLQALLVPLRCSRVILFSISYGMPSSPGQKYFSTVQPLISEVARLPKPESGSSTCLGNPKGDHERNVTPRRGGSPRMQLY